MLASGSMTSGMHSGAFWRPTCARDGDGSIKLRGLVMRRTTDSTRNCDPRERTEKKSTPYMRANSAVRSNTSVLARRSAQYFTRRNAYDSARSLSVAWRDCIQAAVVAQLYTGERSWRT